VNKSFKHHPVGPHLHNSFPFERGGGGNDFAISVKMLTGTCDARKNNDNNNLVGGRTFSGRSNRRHCDCRPPRPKVSAMLRGGRSVEGDDHPVRHQPLTLYISIAVLPVSEREFQKSNCLRVSLPPPPLTSHRCLSPPQPARAPRGPEPVTVQQQRRSSGVHSDEKFILVKCQ